MLKSDDHLNVSRGDKGLAIAISYYVEHGCCVSLPLNDSQDYDIVVDTGGLEKIQIKTTTYIHQAKGIYVVSLCSGRVKKKVEDCGYNTLFIANDQDDIWIIPREDLIHVKSDKLGLGTKYNKYKVT